MKKASFLFIFFLIIVSSVCWFFLFRPLLFDKPLLTQLSLKIEDITKKRLENGLVVIIKEVHNSPIVSIGAFIRTGSCSEGKFQGSGISHLVEHMIFKGAPGRRRGELEKEIKLYGGMINGATSRDYTEYIIQIPAEHFNKAVEILKDALLMPCFDAAELEKEKLVILKEIMLKKDDPMDHLYDLFNLTAYQVHPYKYPTIGYEDLLLGIKRDDLIEYYNANYTPDNIVVAVVGDIDREKALQKIHDEFGNLLPRPFVQPFAPWEPPQISTREEIEEYPVKTPKLVMGFHTVAVSHPDMFALDTLSIILGSGKTSRLYKNLYLKKKLVYRVVCFNFTPRYPGTLQILCELEEKDLSATKKAVMDEIEKIKQRGVKTRELIKAKRAVLSYYIMSLRTQEGQTDDLGKNEIFLGDPLFSKKYVEGINKITKKDIIAVARKYLNSDNLTTVALVPPKEIKKEVIKGQKLMTQSEIKKYTLLNGVRVLLREDNSLPVVNVFVAFNGGLRAENKDINGISNLTAKMLLEGTKRRTAKDIANLVETMGAVLESFSFNNSFGLQFEVLSGDFDKAIDLIADIVKNPAFPTKELTREKELVLADIKSQDEDIFGLASRLLRENLFKIHPYGLNIIGTKEPVENLKRQDLVNFYRRFCVGQNMVIGIFGDIKEKDALDKIKRHFSTIPKKEFSFPAVLQEPLQNEIRGQMYYVDKEEAVILIGFHTTSIFDKDKYVLLVLDNILSTAGGRLFYEVREKLGLAYAVGAYQIIGPDPGYFILYAAIAPQSTDIVRKKLLEEIRFLKTGYIPDTEFKAAKQNLITAHQIALQTNSDLSAVSCLDELAGLGFDNYKNYEKNINAVTKEDVKKAAQKYFNLNAYTEILILPRSWAQGQDLPKGGE